MPITKTLPWEYRDALGNDGLPVNEDEAIRLIEFVGVHATNRLGDTALSTAAMLGRTRTIEWLLEKGAEVDYVVSDSYCKTPLLWACEQMRLSAAEILLDHGANIEAIDRFNNTPSGIYIKNSFHQKPRFSHFGRHILQKLRSIKNESLDNLIPHQQTQAFTESPDFNVGKDTMSMIKAVSPDF